MPSSAHLYQTMSAGGLKPLHELLDERAALNPNSIAYRFLADGVSDEHLLSYGELANHSRLLAAGLAERNVSGKPVLLIQPPGPGFIEGLFACWHAGAIAVPAYPPRGSRHRQRLAAILADSGATLALAPSGYSPPIPGMELLAADELLSRSDPLDGPASSFSGPCLIQYTSGSTAAPKGVMISHDNIRSHFASMRVYDDLGFRSALSWLPPYHDMGLVLKILFAFEAGIPLTHFSPEHFIQRPARWLQAISRYRAELSGGPNFAYEACLKNVRDEDLVGVDLSCWKAAACGAERILPETLERFAERFQPYGFRPEAFFPGYGLAESTLIATACHRTAPYRISKHPKAGRLVSNGPPLPGVTLRIVDPNTEKPLKPREIGEIRIKGATISSGYWKRSLETKSSFSNDGELRTGDLGYLEDGELFVTGRIKDLIIIDGVNLAPEDIESSVLTAISEISAVAAFSTLADGKESITLAVEAESVPAGKIPHLGKQIREVVANDLEVTIRRIAFVRRGLIPRTTSGKIQRSACRAALAEGLLKVFHDDDAHGARRISLDDILEAANEVLGRTGTMPDDGVIHLGMGSLDATRLSALLRSRTGVDVSVSEFFSAESFADLARSLACRTASESARPEFQPGTRRTATLLSHAQERMWLLHQFDPTSAAYHVFGALELTGPVSPQRLQATYREVVSRHGILRSRHGHGDGQPKFWMDAGDLPDMELSETDNDATLRSRLTGFARTPFDLATDPPIRALLISSGKNRHILAVCVHHIAADGWSLRLLARELADTYAGLPATPAQDSHIYQDYAASHRAWIDGGAIEPQIQYWKNQLAGHSGILQLPTDFPRPNKPSSTGGCVVRILSTEFRDGVAQLARERRATPFMVHLAAFFLLLRQHGAGHDLVVAIPVANRNHSAASNLIGTLVNTLPLRMDVRADDTFNSLLERIRTTSFGMQENQDAPFEKIIEAVRPHRSGDHSPLAQVMFDHQEIPLVDEWPGGVTCKPFIAHRGAAQFDLSLLLTIHGDEQQLAIEYRSDLFLEETANSMLDRLLAIHDEVRRQPTAPLGSLLAPSDLAWLSVHQQGPCRPGFPRQNTPGLIATRCVMHPHREAVFSDGGSLTYQELADRSDRLASALISHGMRPGDRMAVLLERDLDLPVALLSIWKSGAAYVPLDRANPVERLKLILADQSPLTVLVSPHLTDHLPPDTDHLTFGEHLFDNAPIADLPAVSPETTAYVIHTSGSTGKPKGVVVSHAALANFLLSMAETPGFTEGDKLLAVTTVSFDISLLEIFLPLVCGGSLEITTTAVARDGHALLERLRSSRATVMQATPATWRMLLDADWKGSPNLKILCGGEALDPELAAMLVTKGCQCWNLYGPTETTVWSTCWRVPAAPGAIRIGKPIANTGIHILTEDGSTPPPGVPGSLWISGAGLADGYWKRPDLTESAFREITAVDGTKLLAYHTGDIARWHSDGTLECLGRSDGQVKIRGFRVETGEIEAAIATHPGVAQAKAALRGNPPRLVAWFTSRPDSPPPSSESLRTFLAERLPAYMIPADVGHVESFPLNSSGKVDVSALPDPECAPRKAGPLSATEERIIAIWCEILNRTSIHPDDNWFHIGGHSLLAMRLFANIHQAFDRRLPLSVILDHPTPRGLARLIDPSNITQS